MLRLPAAGTDHWASVCTTQLPQKLKQTSVGCNCISEDTCDAAAIVAHTEHIGIQTNAAYDPSPPANDTKRPEMVVVAHVMGSRSPYSTHADTKFAQS